MPLDGTASRRRVRLMPWQGHNAAVVAARHAPPRLPRGWTYGAVFAARRHLEPETLPAPEADGTIWEDDMRALAGQGSARQRLLALLEALDRRRGELPHAATLATLLDASPTDVAKAFAALVRGRHIRVVVQRGRAFQAQHRAVLMLATGGVLRTPGVPPEWTP